MSADDIGIDLRPPKNHGPWGVDPPWVEGCVDTEDDHDGLSWVEHALSGRCSACAEAYDRWEPNGPALEDCTRTIYDSMRPWRAGTAFALSPRQVAPAWVKGLTTLGIRAKKAILMIDGKRQPLDLVIEIDCPYDHVDETGDNFAKVLLRVNPHTGWVDIREGSCERCEPEAIERWLLTCQSCLENRPEHTKHFPLNLADFEDGGSLDDSPVVAVAQVMRDMALGKIDAKPTAKKSKAEGPTIKTGEQAVKWLDSLVTEGGKPLVPPSLGQSATWEAVKSIPGHPSQTLVRQGQAARKTRSEGP